MSRSVEISFFMFRRNATETITVIFFLFTASMLLSFDTKKINKTKKKKTYLWPVGLSTNKIKANAIYKQKVKSK